MRWYSLRCFFSSLGFLGGSHEGRVRERYFCFSTEGWKGSIRGSLLRTGGSAGFLLFGSGWLIDAERVRPGCCREISCFRSNSDWNSSSFSVINLASVSNAVYVSAHVFCCAPGWGDTPLLETLGEGVRWETRAEGAGDVLEDEETPGCGDINGGLSPVHDAGDRS